VKGRDEMTAAREPERPALALFAAELRAARGHAGLSREDLAVKLNYSASLVAMIETERRTPSRDFAARCDEVFDTPGTFSRLEERLRDLPYPASFRPFAGYEAEARSLRMFEHVLVPGLLQTPEYARAVLSTRPHTTSDELESLVAARLARQVVLDRKDPPLLWVVLDEGVLHRPVGTAEVMGAQLRRLAALCDEAYVTLQVIPFSAGGHIGLLGAFVIAEMGDLLGIAYLETAADGQTVEDAATVSQVALRFDSLRSEALPHSASKDLIVKLAEEKWT
jgi:transcriptional regulator with XRE-family HTH domain